MRGAVAEVRHVGWWVGRGRGRLASLFLVLGVRSVVIARAPTRIQLQVQLLLLARHVVVLRLLRAIKTVPLKTKSLAS